MSRPKDVIDAQQKAHAIILAKSPCVIAGLDIASEAFRQLDPSVDHGASATAARCEPDGRRGVRRSRLATADGGANGAELHAAAVRHRYADAAIRRCRRRADHRAGYAEDHAAAPRAREIRRSRWRGVNHRSGLDDGILIKDNHVPAGRWRGQCRRADEEGQREMATEVEAQSLQQVDDALAAGADIILLDNLSTPDIIAARWKVPWPRQDGDLRRRDAGAHAELAATGADYCVDRRADPFRPGCDLSFEIEPGEHDTSRVLRSRCTGARLNSDRSVRASSGMPRPGPRTRTQFKLAEAGGG